MHWTIDSHSLTDPYNQGRETSVTKNTTPVGMLSSVLTIKALPINDGILVGCAVVDENFNHVSKGANLTVLGENIHSTYSSIF